MLEQMQGRRANKNTLEVKLLSERVENDALHFFSVACVYAGEKYS